MTWLVSWTLSTKRLSIMWRPRRNVRHVPKVLRPIPSSKRKRNNCKNPRSVRRKMRDGTTWRTLKKAYLSHSFREGNWWFGAVTQGDDLCYPPTSLLWYRGCESPSIVKKCTKSVCKSFPQSMIKGFLLTLITEFRKLSGNSVICHVFILSLIHMNWTQSKHVKDSSDNFGKYSSVCMCDWVFWFYYEQ